MAYDVPGGVWINLGPLLYHYSDIPGENSIEPTYEMVKEIIQDVGFVMEVKICVENISTFSIKTLSPCNQWPIH